MKVVTVARCPVPGSVSACCVEHGCGALNIDPCRIRTDGEQFAVPQSDPGKRRGTVGTDLGITRKDIEGFQAAQRASIERTLLLGRWPANLILQHRPECACVGTKQVKPSNGSGAGSRGYQTKYGGEAKSRGFEGTHVEGGMETVGAWQCEDGCAVRELGGQSGEQTTRYVPPRKKASPFSSGRTWEVEGRSLREGTASAPLNYGDDGTAARYFKQVQSKDDDMAQIPDELWDYLETMITPPAACEPALIVTADLNDVDWDAYGDQSVHGVITVGNPEKHMTEMDRVLKPGAHLLVISDEKDLTGATAACAIEDFGYQIRDAIAVLDTPGECHYLAKASTSERNAGVPEFEAEVTFERYFPIEGVDQDVLWDQIVEVVDENYLENWLLEGIPGDELPDHLLSFFEERVLVDVQTFRNNHPTVKPVALMGALMGDIPKGSTVVDPFMGSGSTGIAALKQGMNFVGIDQDEQYLKIAHHRIHHADRSNASWDAADIQSEVVEEKPAAKSLTDFFGIS